MTIFHKIPVRFDQDAHTYTNTETGKMLKGITSTLIHRLFPDKYSGVPKAVMENAAARGSRVHEEIELVETVGIAPSSDEGKNYLKLKEEHKLRLIESEYTVSDLVNYATNIDGIYEVSDNVVDLADYKTTYKLDKDSLSWQLSICAYFLERNNPHVRVRNLYGIWLRGEIAKMVQVDRRPDDEVEALIRADLEDRDFAWNSDFPDFIKDNEELLYALHVRIQELTSEYEQLKAEILKRMMEEKYDKFDLGNMSITYVAAGEKTTFDSKRFASEHEEEYKQYLKTTPTKESIRIHIK